MGQEMDWANEFNCMGTHFRWPTFLCDMGGSKHVLMGDFEDFYIHRGYIRILQ